MSARSSQSGRVALDRDLEQALSVLRVAYRRAGGELAVFRSEIERLGKAIDSLRADVKGAR